MTNTAEESHTDGFQILDSVKKKKRRLGRETHGQHAGAGFFSPLLLSDNSSFFSWRFDDQTSEDTQASQKKSKQKARQEKSDSQLDYSCITTESELTSEAATGVCRPKKKKKRKLIPNEQNDGDQLHLPLSQGKAGSQLKANRFGNGYCSDRGISVKKKIAKAFIAEQDETSKVCAGPMKNRTDSASSDKREEAGHSTAEDTEAELFTFSPCKTQHSSLSQEKAATRLATPMEQGSPVAPRKPHKHKKSSGAEGYDSTAVTPREPRKHKASSDMEDPDRTDVTPKKPCKHKKCSGEEDPDRTDVTSREPRKHKKSSGMEDPDGTDIATREPHKLKKSSGVEDPDSTDVTPREPRKHKKSSGVEDPDGTDIATREPCKHKKSSGDEDPDRTNVTSREPHKLKKSSGVEDLDSTDVTPREPHNHKKSRKHKKSIREDPDGTDVATREPCKLKKSSGDEDPDRTDVTPKKPSKHKKSSGEEYPDMTDVTSREPHKHKKSSSMEDPDRTDIATREPHKLKKSSGVEDPDSTDVTPREPRKHKKSSGVEDPDGTDIATREPCKLKKSFGDEDPDRTDVTPKKPRKHKKPSGDEDPDRTDVTSREPRKHKKASGVEDSDSTDVTPRGPCKHKKSSGVEDPDSTDVTPREPRKHKKSSGVEDPDRTDVTSREPRKHKKSSGVEDPDSTDVTPREPRKHKKCSGVEDPDGTDIATREPCKLKKSSGNEDPDRTDVTPKKPRKHKKSSGDEDPDRTDVTSREPRKHKKASGVEDPDRTDVTPKEPRKHKKSSGDEDPDGTNVTPREPRKHKKASAVEEPDSTDVTPKKPHKHKKSSSEEDPHRTDIATRKPRKHKKSSGVVDSDTTDIGFEMEETVKSVTNHDRGGNESQAEPFPLEDNNELPKTPKDVGKLSPTEHPASQSFSVADDEFQDFSKLVVPDLDVATRELEEFIPHVRNLSASVIKQMASRDLIRFKKFKQKGIAVKFGKFTNQENNQLRKNMEAFLQESKIESAEKLLFPHRFPEERVAIHKLKAKHLFGIRIAEGIPRPWRYVYDRARKIFDPRNYSGRYSKKEKRKLIKYQAMNGNDWKKISELMSRSSHSVSLKYSQIKSKPESGPWSKEETKRLIQAVGETLQANSKELGSALEEEEGKALSVVREDLYKGISWVKVEAAVGTRHWRQCKQKWLLIVTKRMSSGRVMASGSQNLHFKINLITRLYELNIEDANEVDWEVLSSVIGDVPPDYIQSRFYKLKSTQVPSWNQKTFPEIIDHLYEVTLPKLKAKLKRKEAKR